MKTTFVIALILAIFFAPIGITRANGDAMTFTIECDVELPPNKVPQILSCAFVDAASSDLMVMSDRVVTITIECDVRLREFRFPEILSCELVGFLPQ